MALVYEEVVGSRGDALRRELEIKRLDVCEKRELAYGPERRRRSAERAARDSGNRKVGR